MDEIGQGDFSQQIELGFRGYARLGRQRTEEGLGALGEVVAHLHDRDELPVGRQRGVEGRERRQQVKQAVQVRNGIDSDNAKKIQRLIKDSKLKVQAAIQGDAVRVTGAKRDDLQAAMALIRKELTQLPLSFNNFRD